jgi:16S rRNA (cytidine1402-2'-O)-methyltransferase
MAGPDSGSDVVGGRGGRLADGPQELGDGPTSPGGRLVLAATPIGDPADASPRLARLLAEADVIAAEDTRRLRRLVAALGVTPGGRVVSHHEHNEAASSAGLVEVVRGGGTVLVVTDAGMPGISDPGLRAVRAVLDAGLPVTAVPGPSAALTALALSGLPSDRFCFEGFLPRAAGKRAAALAALAAEPRTMIFFESPRRTADTLAAMTAAFGVDRPGAICRELTKTYEEVRRDGLAALADWAAEREVLGEVTLVVGGAQSRGRVGTAELDQQELEELLRQVQARVDGGQRRKEAVTAVALAAGVDRRALYDAAHRKSGPS